MGRLIRLLVASALAIATSLADAPPADAFDEFGAMEADATYGVAMEFGVDIAGTPPEQLDLLLRFPGTDADFVAPVTVRGGRATYRWDAAAAYVSPNSRITYRWRATDGDQVVLSEPGELLYDDDRPGFDWQSEAFGEATVHWYTEADAQARGFGELTAVGVDRAEELLGVELAAPVDIFAYATRDDFFGALGPGTREWTGAAIYPEIRTIYMWLEGGPESYLETAILHEVTHLVFHDATDNPFHEPALWLNEGIATWAETQSDDGERGLVESEASQGLFAFEAITDQFPIGERGGFLAYAQGTTMIDMIVEEYGTDALAAICAAYREGASDAEAIEAGTGVPDDQLYADFYAAFGVSAPEPVEPEPILPSNVEVPPAAGHEPGPGPVGTPTAPQPAPGEPGSPADVDPWIVVLALIVGIGLAAGAALFLSRRAARRAEERR